MVATANPSSKLVETVVSVSDGGETRGTVRAVAQPAAERHAQESQPAANTAITGTRDTHFT